MFHAVRYLDIVWIWNHFVAENRKEEKHSITFTEYFYTCFFCSGSFCNVKSKGDKFTDSETRTYFQSFTINNLSIATSVSSLFAVDAAGCYDIRWFIKTPKIREQKQKQTECGVKMGLLHDGDVLPCQLHSHAELQSVNAKLLGKNNWRKFMVMTPSRWVTQLYNCFRIELLGSGHKGKEEIFVCD